MICNKRILIFLAEECIKLCSSVNRHMGVKGGLNHNKRQDISKITISYYHKKIFSTHEYQERNCWFQEEY